MGKRVINVLLFIAVLAASAGITVYVGQGAAAVMIYNFVFLGIMAVIYLTGLIGGMFRMNGLSEALEHGEVMLSDIFRGAGRASAQQIPQLEGLFIHKYLDQKMSNFIIGLRNSESGIEEIENYLNEDELDNHIHKRLLEMIPDILTSLGILGTFVGLVWGLKNFQPDNYEAMTTSVSALVEGIKVAFLTSIYGISLSIIYTYGMKSEYSHLMEALQAFLEKFHAFVLPTAENESRNLLMLNQKNQTMAMEKMAEEFSTQLAGSFEKVITPTFAKMNDSLDTLTNSVVRCQKDAIKEILDVFLKEMNQSFQMEFRDFNEALNQMKTAQKDNVEYTSELYHNMSQQLNEAYGKQERAMKEMLREMNTMQNHYMSAASRIVEENQEIQKQQQADYQHVVDYLRDAEKSSAKFWVACNQTMQKYVETAAQAMEKTASAGQVSTQALESNRRIVEEFDRRIQEFVQYQKMSYKTMDQVCKLLSDIIVTKSDRDVYLTGGRMNQNYQNREMLDSVQEMLESQGEQQQKVLEEISGNLRELSRGVQKGKFKLFK